MTEPHPGGRPKPEQDPRTGQFVEGNSGRPPEYEPKFADQAAKLCKLGATDKELAEFFEVTTRTIYAWKNEHEPFSQAVKVGKESADDRVERSLYNRAVGYTFESEKVFQHQGKVIRAGIDEHVPPDPGAAFNWLKNRKPDDWRDMKTLGGDPKKPISLVTRIERVIVDGTNKDG